MGRPTWGPNGDSASVFRPGMPSLSHPGAIPYNGAMPFQIRIDKELCSGYGECVALAPEVFELSDRNVSVVLDPEGTDDETILDAARACPVDAITLIDECEDQVWPA